MRVKNETLAEENARLRAELARVNAKLEETALIMKFFAESLHPFDDPSPPPRVS